jgi:LL-H family phage holin
MNEYLLYGSMVLVFVVVLFFMRFAVPYMKTALEHSKFKFIAEAAAYAVKYAEQTITGDGKGAERKAIVTKFLEDMLMAKKISISAEQIDALIEAAVYAMNLAKKV